MKIKIAVFNHYSPLKDFIYTCKLPEGQTPEQVVNEINLSLKDAHCELVSVEKERKRS